MPAPLLAAALAERVLASWLVLAVGSSLLLGTATLVTSRLPRAAAATRFAIWMGATTGLLLVAGARAVLPAREVSVPWWPAASVPATSGAGASAGRTNRMTIAAQASDVGGDRQHNEHVNDRQTVTSTSLTGGTSVGATSRDAMTTRPELGAWIGLVALAVLLAWLGGAVLLAARVVRSRWQVRALVRQSSRILDGRHLALLQQVAERMGVDRGVALRWVSDEQIPVTTGIVHPVILLPRVAMQWPEARLRMVLQHEMAHIARADVALMTLAQLALMICWWQPLLWHAVRAMESERERACDDLVLTSGVAATDYADELLHVVRALRTPAPLAFAALGMAHHADSQSQVEARLRAVLDPRLPRRRTPRSVSVLVAVLAIAVAPAGRLMPRTVGGGTSTGSGAAAAQATPPGRSPGTTTADGLAGSPRGDFDQPDPSDDFLFGDPCVTRAGSVSISRSVDDSIQRYQRIDQTGCLRMHLVGRPEFDANDVPIRLTGDQVRLDIEEIRGARHRRVSMRATAGVLEPSYIENGRAVSPADTAAMRAATAWAQELYRQVARDVGLGVHTRVPRLLRTGGAAALAREVRAIRADDVTERYLITALATPTTTAERSAIATLARAFAARASDATRRRISAAIADSGTAPEGSR